MSQAVAASVATSGALVRPKTRLPHPAALAAAKLDNEVSMDKPLTPVQDSAPVSQPAPQVSAPEPTTPVQEPAKFVDVLSMPIPDGYGDLMASKPAPREERVSEDTRVAEAERRLKEENAALMKQLEDAKKELEASRVLSEDLQRMKMERELDAFLQAHGSEFSSIDPADAKRLLAPMMQSMREQASATDKRHEERLHALEESMRQQVRKLEEREQRSRLNKTRDAILKAHPDLEQLQKTPEYQKMMMSPVGGSSGILVGQLVAAEYQQGNADYIISVLNQIKQGAQDLSKIASISPTGANTQPVVPQESTPELTEEQLAHYVFLVQSGQMKRSDFQKLMQKQKKDA